MIESDPKACKIPAVGNHHVPADWHAMLTGMYGYWHSSSLCLHDFQSSCHRPGLAYILAMDPPSFIFLDEYASSQTHLFLPFLTGALAFAGAFFGAVFVCLPAGADTAGASCKFHQTKQSNFHQVTTHHHGLSSFKCLQ